MESFSAAAQILTLTVNPALDISTSTAEVVAEHKLRCSTSRLAPGGGGVNVSRVVRRLGGRTVALFTAGGPLGDAYRRLVEGERVPSVVVPIEGSTRESFTVDDTANGSQYRFVLAGPHLSDREWRSCLDYVSQTVSPGGYLVASGSLPPGVPDDFYARVVRLARNAGARCVVDSTGPALAAALTEGTFLVAPSRRELETHVGSSLDTAQSRLEAASALIADGGAEYVALTLGAEGAVLASREETYALKAPVVDAVSSVGAGDSFLAGFVLRLSQGRSVQDAFRTAVAAGAAAVTTPASELCRREDVERFELGLSPEAGRKAL
ncbi:1-phosphofructokinase family hexose kinase [Leifsonia sp. EB34]|uniref:1-phosphofructokinase family hexose kinase n=1 Tax=Leifsonia sp. EB34 TaxID=3156303 RepID=UPI0035134390